MTSTDNPVLTQNCWRCSNILGPTNYTFTSLCDWNVIKRGCAHGSQWHFFDDCPNIFTGLIHYLVLLMLIYWDAVFNAETIKDRGMSSHVTNPQPSITAANQSAPPVSITLYIPQKVFHLIKWHRQHRNTPNFQLVFQMSCNSHFAKEISQFWCQKATWKPSGWSLGIWKMLNWPNSHIKENSHPLLLMKVLCVRSVLYLIGPFHQSTWGYNFN